MTSSVGSTGRSGKPPTIYDLRRGQPPIPPRVIASIILYGNLTRIRSSRKLEEALQVRLDFRWLVEGRSIDHTTISNFRRSNADSLCDTFVQMGMLARQLGWMTLEVLAFDGTRVRANNRRRGSRTPDELRKMKEELAAKPKQPPLTMRTKKFWAAQPTRPSGSSCQEAWRRMLLWRSTRSVAILVSVPLL